MTVNKYTAKPRFEIFGVVTNFGTDFVGNDANRGASIMTIQ